MADSKPDKQEIHNHYNFNLKVSLFGDNSGYSAPGGEWIRPITDAVRFGSQYAGPVYNYVKDPCTQFMGPVIDVARSGSQYVGPTFNAVKNVTTSGAQAVYSSLPSFGRRT